MKGLRKINEKMETQKSESQIVTLTKSESLCEYTNSLVKE